jgi:hypothetical protein
MSEFADERRRQQLLQSIAWGEQKLTDPDLDPDMRRRLVRELAKARRALQHLAPSSAER